MTSNINIISVDTTIFERSEDVLLSCDAIVGPSCQHFRNVVNRKVGIPITM